MAVEKLKPPSFSEATEEGEVINRSGYHSRRNTRSPYSRIPDCGCEITTKGGEGKGAYRDVSVQMPDGRVVHFYHQSPVVVENEGRIRVSACGWKTSTTKERINRHLPRGVFLRQRDYDWYVEDRRGDEMVSEEYQSGMVIEA